MLCANCAVVDFNGYLGTKIVSPILLGTLDRIRQNRQCSFCRLVAHALASGYSSRSRIFLCNELSWRLGIELSPYDRSRSVSYSNKFDLRSQAKEIYRPAYRFIVTDDPDPESFEPSNRKSIACIQYLAHKEKATKQKQQFFGRRVLPGSIDLGIIRSWLDLCETWHASSCDCSVYEIDKLPRNLRLIDARNRQIIKVEDVESIEYVVLSYVWGIETMRRETGMVPATLQKSSFRGKCWTDPINLPEKVPATIDDAIRLTVLLGYRYIWVDALCIIQDDSFQEKVVHLENMKAIYSCASLTIAAAAGDHADYGLPGMSVARSREQYSERVHGLRLATMFPSYTDLEASTELPWNTRGWTFQEKLLSKRLLLFTDSQVYFKCSEAVWTEEIVMETGQLSKSVEARPRKYRWEPSRQKHVASAKATGLRTLNPTLKVNDDWGYLQGFLDYTFAIQEFTKRKLTDKRDTLFAISGVLETMEAVNGSCVFGLPRRYMLEALLWYPKQGAIQLSDWSDDLPSWSWANSVFERGGVAYDLMDIRFLLNILDVSERAFAKDSDKDSTSKDSDDETPSAFALSKMYSNLAISLARPLLQYSHTIKTMCYFDGSNLRRLDIQHPINLIDFLGRKDHSSSSSIVQSAKRYAQKRRDEWRPPSIRALGSLKRVLVFETKVLQFRIGDPIYEKVTYSENEVGIFELLNDRYQCVGEVNTTYNRAKLRGQQDFLTIRWGLSLEHASLDNEYIPRWRLNSQGTEDGSFTFWNKEKADQAFAKLIATEFGHLSLLKSVLGSTSLSQYSQFIPDFIEQQFETASKPSQTSDLITTLYNAKKNEPRPKMLWPVVNVILVDWHKGVARRAGVGKVIMKAWQECYAQPEDIILA